MRAWPTDGRALALRAVRAALGPDTGALLVIETVEARDWASATFVGRALRLGLRLEGTRVAVRRGARALRRRLPEIDGGGETGTHAARFFLAGARVGTCRMRPAPGRRAVAALTVEALTIAA